MKVCIAKGRKENDREEENVLHDIDFLAESSRTTAIIGSNGCGSNSQFEDVVA